MFKVMFLCTANSCRSQMAEGLARQLGLDAYSAGLFAAGLHPRAVAAMAEIGIDILRQHSKTIDEDLMREMDVVITLCGNAEAYCPVPPEGVGRIHWPIKDPVGAEGTEEEKMQAFRKTRDEIKKRIEKFILKNRPS